MGRVGQAVGHKTVHRPPVAPTDRSVIVCSVLCECVYNTCVYNVFTYWLRLGGEVVLLAVVVVVVVYIICMCNWVTTFVCMHS